jgi:tRNA threonylcarbamoyl adenosine modification protein (Sua5/YciO/YrdC/YwlC family)
MLLTIHPLNPEPRKIAQVIECLQNGGTIIYPTDTVYGFGCDIFQQKAVEHICRIKNIKPEKANFSFICYDLSHITDYAALYDNTTFKLMKKTLPGPFTFILKASNNIPKLFKNNKRTVGIRIPDNLIARTLVQQLERPILSTSLTLPPDDIREYWTDPYEIHEAYERLVDIVIDGGFGGNTPSTIVDCTADTPTVIREGAGILPL